ncbi:MAG: ABC transporter permease [Firmicutes bacterium]|nr:ABC transporter permease [Bacillota bacterium]
MEAYIEYFTDNWQQYLQYLGQHIYISVLAIAAAAAIGIPSGILCEKNPVVRRFFVGFFSTLRIIPSLAILVVLIPVMGIGVKPALVALVILAVPPIIIQTTLGFAEVPEFMLEAATAMGMDEKMIFRRVSLPMALPHIIGGIKIASAEVIASAALAAYIGSGGLGVIIYNGIALMKTEYLVIGGGSVAILTMLCTMIIGKIERKMVR